jgi:hypothetical protein
MQAPAAAPEKVAATANGMVERAPTRSRLSTSRPSWSAPNQCFTPGAANRPAKSMASGW